MKTFDEVAKDIEAEFRYQDSRFSGNDKKPLEVWMLIFHQYANDAMERYAHGTQDESREKIVKAVACGIRALMSDKVRLAE